MRFVMSVQADTIWVESAEALFANGRCRGNRRRFHPLKERSEDSRLSSDRAAVFVVLGRHVRPRTARKNCRAECGVQRGANQYYDLKSVRCAVWLAEGVGFEPTVRLRARRFSRPVYSTTLAPLRGSMVCNQAGCRDNKCRGFGQEEPIWLTRACALLQELKDEAGGDTDA